MPDLEQQLTELGQSIDWPTPPHLWGGVSRRLTEGRRSRPALWRSNSRWALAAVAVLLILATLLAYTPSRDAIANWIDLHVGITRVQQLPTPRPLPTGTLGSQLGLGLPYTLQDAQRLVKWKITVPSELGRPDAVYFRTLPEGGEVTLVYGRVPDIPVAGETGVAVLVTEVQGRVREDYFEKMIGPNTTIEQVAVNGQAGFWISGTPHLFVFQDANGDAYPDTLRLATNTLVFSSGGTIIRIEAYTSKDRAIQIAGSLQPR